MKKSTAIFMIIFTLGVGREAYSHGHHHCHGHKKCKKHRCEYHKKKKKKYKECKKKHRECSKNHKKMSTCVVFPRGVNNITINF